LLAADSSSISELTLSTIVALDKLHLQDAGLGPAVYFYTRETAVEFWKFLQKHSGCILVCQGSPGAGKSTEAWLWFRYSAAKASRSCLWCHFDLSNDVAKLVNLVDCQKPDSVLCKELSLSDFLVCFDTLDLESYELIVIDGYRSTEPGLFLF
jgi:hypothetical protein